MRSTVQSALILTLLALFLACPLASAEDGITVLPVVTPAEAQPNLELDATTSQMVVEPGDALEVVYALANTGGGPITIIQRAASPAAALPVTVKVTDAQGAPLAEATFGKPGGRLSLPGVTSTGPMRITGTEKVAPKDKWPLGTLKVQVSYSVVGENYGSMGVGPIPGNFTGTLSSPVVDVIVKPEGWREKTYRAYVSAIEKMVRERMKEHSFEFREARKMVEPTITADKAAASACIAMNYEALTGDIKTETPRLKTFPGSYTIFVSDPRSTHPAQPELSALLDNGLVYVWFVSDLQSNFYIQKLHEVTQGILNDLQSKPLSLDSSTPAMESTGK